jgi:glycosyltransferase involved in cell wall biosynthesis
MVGIERIFRFFLTIIRTWRNEGFRALLQKTFPRLRIKKLRNVPLDLNKSADTYMPIIPNVFVPQNIDIKLIAFYLPQFHPISENDEWWGKGFTEWANVSKAVPNFEGHYQPHLPGELGYYDLRLPEVMEQQVELAKKYGVYGFCFYYYWFKGKRLLERPLDQYLANLTLDFPFCLCWANENWTRRWDGADHDILIAQEYTPEQYLHFVQDISKHFSDPRYIRVDGKPMLLVYRVNLLPDPQKAVEVWRAECRKLGVGEIYLVAVQSFGITDPRPYGFDAAVEFPPSNLGEAEISNKSTKLTNPDFKGRIFDYHVTVRAMLEKKQGDYTYFKTVMPAWDNTARKQNDAHIFINSSPTAYKAWLEKVVSHSRKTLPEDKRFAFVNAWNEWAEGTHLEPDKKYGYAYLQATADAITKKKSISEWTILFVSHDANKGGAQQVLINIVGWFTKKTNINVKVLCLNDGAWLDRFTGIADTLVLSELGKINQEDEILEQIQLFCEGTPDLIYANTVATGSAFAWLSKLNVPILTHFHELETSIHNYGEEWIGDVLRLSSHFIACSKAVQTNLVDNHAISPQKISTVYASIESKQASLPDDKTKKEIRKKLGLEENKAIIFGCGIGMPFRKGADLFIQLGETLLQKGHKNFHLYWIGGFDLSYYDDTHGSWKNHYAKLKKHDLNKYVTFLGMKDDPREYLVCGDVFVLPSREDPFPLVALEAADCGLPILCFDKAGGMPDFVGENGGFVVPQDDLETLAQKLIELIEHKELRQKLGKQARENLINGFTTEQTTPHILSVSRKVSGKKPAVSVIVPNYNHAPYLEQRLNSIFSQSFRDFDVILLDDASSDNSIQVLQKYMHHADVQLICNETNSGSPFKQWIKGIDIAKSDILWIAESDDSCDPEFLKTLLPAFTNKSVNLAYANSSIIDEYGNIIGDYINTEYLSSLSKIKWNYSYKVTAEQEINDGLGVKNTILNISSALLRRFEMDMDFRNTLERLHIAGDWYFIVHAIKDGQILYNAKKLNSHRRHSKSVIAQTVNEKRTQDFFKEFFIVQNYIIKSYNLTQDFPFKWESYIKKQWGEFTNDQSLEKLSAYYPIESVRHAIEKNIGASNVKQ